MRRILIIHGPNLNLLGKRDPEIYGKATLAEIDRRIREVAAERGLAVNIMQSNHEGEIIDAIQRAEGEYGGIIINPAGFSHSSVAIRDALEAVAVPAVEVHLSHIYTREVFRRESLTAPACRGQISGLGSEGYILALEYFSRSNLEAIKSEESNAKSKGQSCPDEGDQTGGENH